MAERVWQIEVRKIEVRKIVVRMEKERIPINHLRRMSTQLLENITIRRLSFYALLAMLLPAGLSLQSKAPFTGYTLQLAWLMIVLLNFGRITLDLFYRIGETEASEVSHTEQTNNVALAMVRFAAPYLFFLALSFACMEAVQLLVPAIGADQSVNLPESNIWSALIVSALGGMEEYWRFTLIILILFVWKHSFRKSWQARPEWRAAGMGAALLLSSLIFGVAHGDEFTAHKITAILLLSASGLILALSTVLTRNFFVGVAVHCSYNFVVSMRWFDAVRIPLYVLAIVFIIYGVVVFIRRRQANT